MFFWTIELRPSPSDVVMSWLRLQTRLECIPHPCHMYHTQCFSTLICCGWTYGCTLTLLHLCRSGVDFRKIELSPSPSDVVMSWSWLRLQTRLECIPHPCHMYTQCFSTLICRGWVYGGTPYTVTPVQVRVDFKENWGGAEPERCCNVMVEAPNLHRLHPTSKSYMYTKCFST